MTQRKRTIRAKKETKSGFARLLERQRAFFDGGVTRDVDARLRQLTALRRAIVAGEREILAALAADLRKPAYEAYLAEIVFLYHEIDFTMKHLGRWAKPRRAGAPSILRPSENYVVPEPYGAALIIGPWNYPFQLTIAPLVGAIAAGNTAILKPSELAPATERVIADLIGRTFDPEFVAVVTGGVDATTALLRERFDHIFFTGGTAVGRIIMEAAAKHLTPVTLELGGKSPTIVLADADIETAARKIAWGKFINAGQTCLAPDYVLVDERVRTRFVDALGRAIGNFYGDDPQASPDYARIITTRHFARLRGLMGPHAPRIGGRTDERDRYIAPTVIENVPLDDPLMREEIFGPLLPVLSVGSLDEALGIVRSMSKPLALYLFTGDRAAERRVIRETSSGAVCVNDVVIHVSNYRLPFGGVGESGMGAYHGQYSFEAFSHLKPVMKRTRLFDMPLRYPPYRGSAMNIVRRIFG